MLGWHLGLTFILMRSAHVINKLHHTRGLHFPYHLLCEPHQTKTCAQRSDACLRVFIDFVSEECQSSFICATLESELQLETNFKSLLSGEKREQPQDIKHFVIADIQQNYVRVECAEVVWSVYNKWGGHALRGHQFRMKVFGVFIFFHQIIDKSHMQ